ncbi:hypothetical protein SLEP1_g28231 [Rubroshorea leprosula]|uniref:Uncharacterized protein n=1 Tax=Rubroshorea leprosula TaxID=152421 RepID=A0AAV5K5E5_9ROSI|nr:hypothetical protein SLEP1_g28231 [Rubroshorea leprosula]
MSSQTEAISEVASTYLWGYTRHKTQVQRNLAVIREPDKEVHGAADGEADVAADRAEEGAASRSADGAATGAADRAADGAARVIAESPIKRGRSMMFWLRHGETLRKWSPAGRVIAESPIKRGRSMMFWLRHGETFRNRLVENKNEDVPDEEVDGAAAVAAVAKRTRISRGMRKIAVAEVIAGDGGDWRCWDWERPLFLVKLIFFITKPDIIFLFILKLVKEELI